jgi:hypothetical protein
MAAHQFGGSILIIVGVMLGWLFAGDDGCAWAGGRAPKKRLQRASVRRQVVAGRGVAFDMNGFLIAAKDEDGRAGHNKQNGDCDCRRSLRFVRFGRGWVRS